MASRKLLIVDDNRGDVDLMRRALVEAGVDAEVQAAENAVQAYAFLRNRDGAALPDAILLDIRMPVFDGHQALAVIKDMSNARRIPVIMFTSSDKVEDRIRSLRAGATCVKVKPPTWLEYVALARDLSAYLGDGSHPSAAPDPIPVA